MKRLLLATVIACVATAASAGTVPKNMLGFWCATDANNALEKGVMLLDRKVPNQTCDDDSILMNIHTDRYDGLDHTCRFTMIKPVFDRNLISTTKTMGVTRTQIEATCSNLHNADRTCNWKEQFSLYREKGSPKFKKTRHYQERCQ